ncbi:MAG: hypothetical protein LQ340_002827 [Diploschistes diacapsis]|nr:MAG: hypothetical protein LQ340_002827 [Diploschistes diacapsis]
MKASIATLVLVATAALASPSANRHKLFHRQNKRAPAPAIQSREAATLTALLSPLGIPAVSQSASVYTGTSGPYVNTITNNAGQDVALVAWNNGQFKLDSSSLPVITVLIPNGQTASISMADNYSGAMTVVHPNSQPSVSGMINDTLIEMTTGQYGVVDISRELNMAGSDISVSGSQCTTSMDQCVFTCLNGEITCGWDSPYQLTNCATGSQPGASFGTYAGADSGGCMIETQLTTTINSLAG